MCVCVCVCVCIYMCVCVCVYVISREHMLSTENDSSRQVVCN